MYRDDERARGVTVKVLDLSSLEELALNYRKNDHPEPNSDCTKAKIYGGPWAVAYKKDGTLVAVCEEGVGYDVTDEKLLELQFHGNYRTRNEDGSVNDHVTSFDMMPFATIELDPAELLEYPIKEEKDLADFVRTFGSRLEQNFWIWFKELS